MGYVRKLADEVVKLMSERGWTLEGATIATGVDRTVIHGMRKHGRVPGEKSLRMWADGVSRDKTPEGIRASRAFWFEAAGLQNPAAVAAATEAPESDAVMGTATKLRALPPQKYRLIADLIDELSAP